ncbi:MAG: ATP-binding protein, partial [Planctomycetota bacterium]
VGNLALPPTIRLENGLDAGTPKVKIDPHQVSIVFRNLLRNARDAMTNGGLIQINADSDDEFVMIHIADNGAGIAAEDMERITEPLYSTKARGMGLGLAICAAILDKNQGRLTVESKLGEGTKFTVHLPRHPDP